jgi:HAE1 family hydrophobic/amphiphilic exporter-1
LIELCVRKPVTVAVGVLLVLLFGLLSLFRIPVQLTPDIVRPEVTVETRWRGASPQEVEREIIVEQEEQLKGVEGVERITSESFYGMGTIVLRFPAGTDLDAAVLRVANRLEQVSRYPAEADKPVILTSSRTDNAMAWFILLRLPGNEADIDGYFDFAEDQIKPRFERVDGVAISNVLGGREQELQVILRPGELAARQLTVSQVLDALHRENANVSAGDFEEGKRVYLVRLLGRYASPADVENVVVATRDGRRVYVRDIAGVRLGMKKRQGFVRQRGEPAIAINCMRRAGANVLEAMAGLKRAVAEVERDLLRPRGLKLLQVYDETEYIEDAIRLVRRNLIVGGMLTIAIIFLFLRSAASTLILAIAIPISIIGSFIFMAILGRTINVISLAGMSFAAGMVVDNSIVTLENIYRLRQQGMGILEAAVGGVREVWGAVLASTSTTIAVFLPVLFIEEQAGQLFRDIALAISCSVGLSLIVSVSVIPMLSARLFRGRAAARGDPLSRLGRSASGFFTRSTERLQRTVSGRLAVVAGMTLAALALTRALLPDAEYLPEGNRNLAIAIVLPPPGYGLEEISRLGLEVERRMAPHWSISAGDRGRLSIKNFFFVARESRVFVGATASDPARAAELVPLMRAALSDLPGVIAVTQQASLFTRGIASGRSIDIEISGPSLERLVELGRQVFGGVLRLLPASQGHQSRPIPSLDLDNPELHVIPDRERARDLGFQALELGITMDALLDGIKASDYQHEGRQMDLTLMGEEPGRRWRTEDFPDLPLYTPEGRLVTLGSVARVVETRGPQQINHVERQRAITIQVVPAAALPVERALRLLREQLVEPLEASGALEGGLYSLRLSGTADDLSRALGAFRWNFLLAVLITYLLMSALFESFLYPLVILFSVPLAGVGGVLGLVTVNRFVAPVALDIVTMLGFVILVGTVVNNAILIVEQALIAIRAGYAPPAAIREAVHSRVRPIFMSALTSVFGMLPLVLFPGSGSELYRGLGSVVAGGLLVSTLFTIFVVPSLFGLVLESKVWLRTRMGRIAALGAAGKGEN